MVKWAVKLSGFQIRFAPQTTIKGQSISDFIVESTGSPIEEVSPIKRVVKEEKLLGNMTGRVLS